ncbi:MAG: trypsin-like peptidase domain-containing protein [Bacteroidota bacterium]|nr:trypsin-like peptidase domain-containing protein [Bacteroidota bacterium]MXW13493.1 PDZ domain-containing protein [Rhodothermaceae bacterium]MXW31702.1 PDZ domain-containing protein [Rhodothermaceae bacterium]MXZ18310.1 PDZ domain-containing protein [Rhodothermaceae bacterium]MYC04312.1 PDZ domain-containing protein [Rhodothermaceae bacterium]
MNKIRVVPTIILTVSVFVAGVLAATLGVNLFDQGHNVGTDLQASSSEILQAPSESSRLEWEEAFVSVAEAVNPSVVQIRSTEKLEFQNNSNPWEGTPFEQLMPNSGMPDIPQVRQGLGSGVLIRSDGYIVTNDHVVGSADKLQVLLYDGRTLTAEVIGRDRDSDLAVIRINETDLPTVTLAASGDIRVGQWVMAFGSPLDEALDNTVTAGIVSAVGRTSNRLARINLYSDFIQTDAAINRGNSGGPLVNMSGQLVGINSAILSPTGNNAGIGFAIPVSIVSNVATQLIDKGRVERGFLGIQFDRVSRSLATALDAPPGSAQVLRVNRDSAADKAGVKAGDIIAGIDGVELTDYLLLRATIGNKSPGDHVLLDIIRGDDRIQIEVTLGVLPEDLSRNNEPNETRREEQGNLDELGLMLRNLDRETLEEKFLVSEEIEGVWIQSIDESSVAFDESDLRRNDVIVEVNKQPVKDIGDFRRAYREIEPGTTFLVKVLRAQAVTEDTNEFLPLMTALTKPE